MVGPKKKSKKKVWQEDSESSTTPSPPVAIDPEAGRVGEAAIEEALAQVDLGSEPDGVADHVVLQEPESVADQVVLSSEEPGSQDSTITERDSSGSAVIEHISSGSAQDSAVDDRPGQVEYSNATKHVRAGSASRHAISDVEHNDLITLSPAIVQTTQPAQASAIRSNDHDQRLSKELAARRDRTGMSPLLGSPPSAIPRATPPRDLRYLSTSPNARSPRRTSLLDMPGHYLMAPDHGASNTNRTVRLDTMSDAGDQAAATKAYDVVLVGVVGALDVYRILPEKMDVIARLDGLAGMVLDAKIMPVVTTEDKASSTRPWVALLIHGPVDDQPWVKYQTTLEVYSLKTQERIAVLYKSLPISTAQLLDGQVPEPMGQLRLDASGSYLALSSGVSGEVFVFKDNLAVGKFWTTVQEQALLALGKRWLVIVCPDSSSTVSVQGTATAVGQPYGLSSYNAPMQPPLTADVDGMHQGVLSRLSRQAAQELLKASRKGVELGLSGWKEFTNPSSPQRESEFPPTNAPEIKKQDQPAVVSIIDLHRPGPVCTFALENGCSFLSLSPELDLLTTDRTGEVTDIWKIDIYGAVKCVQRIERNSPSTVLGAVWSGNSLALQTARTIHLHEIGGKQKAPQTWSWNHSGGRMFVKGLAQGLSFAKSGVHDAWHADDNKIRVSGDVRWIREGLAVASKTNVYVYSVAKVEKGLKVEHGRRDFALPDTSGPGFWGLRVVNERPKVQEQDEIDTNPYYCPFHVDRRVSLLVYTPSGKDWCFGDPIPMGVKVNTEDYDDFEERIERSVFRVDE